MRIPPHKPVSWTLGAFMIPYDDARINWLAQEIFRAYPYDCPGLKIYMLDCECIYYRRVFRDGRLDGQVGIYRDPARGACEVCMSLPKAWAHRVMEEMLVYNTGAVIQSFKED